MVHAGVAKVLGLPDPTPAPAAPAASAPAPTTDSAEGKEA